VTGERMVRGESPEDLEEMPTVEHPEREVCLDVMEILEEMVDPDLPVLEDRPVLEVSTESWENLVPL